jgi:hypothetical protein
MAMPRAAVARSTRCRESMDHPPAAVPDQPVIPPWRSVPRGGDAAGEWVAGECTVTDGRWAVTVAMPGWPGRANLPRHQDRESVWYKACTAVEIAVYELNLGRDRPDLTYRPQRPVQRLTGQG